MIVTTCFGPLRPSSGFRPKVWWWCFIGLVWVCQDGQISASVMLFLRGTGGGSVICVILGCAAQVCLLAAVLCGSPVTVCPYPMSTAAAAGQTVAGDPHRTAAS